MNGLYLDNTDLAWQADLPEYMEGILGDAPVACRFEKLREAAKQNLHADENKIGAYLGTYFPRSFCESVNVHNVLFGLDPVRRHWVNKKRISVLDFGCGTGGNLAGLLTSLARVAPRAAVDVHVLEGNTRALAVMQNIIASTATELDLRVQLHTHQHVFSPDTVSFEEELRDALRQVPDDLDIVMAWKSISELFIADPNLSTGYYSTFIRTCRPKLNENGFFSLLDVTIRERGRWIPTQLTRELLPLLATLPELDIWLPFGCALRNGICSSCGCYPKFAFPVSHHMHARDETKFTYFALGAPDTAEALRSLLPADVPCQEECGRNASAFRMVPICE